MSIESTSQTFSQAFYIVRQTNPKWRIRLTETETGIVANESTQANSETAEVLAALAEAITVYVVVVVGGALPCIDECRKVGQETFIWTQNFCLPFSATDSSPRTNALLHSSMPWAIYTGAVPRLCWRSRWRSHSYCRCSVYSATLSEFSLFFFRFISRFNLGFIFLRHYAEKWWHRSVTATLRPFATATVLVHFLLPLRRVCHWSDSSSNIAETATRPRANNSKVERSEKGVIEFGVCVFGTSSSMNVMRMFEFVCVRAQLIGVLVEWSVQCAAYSELADVERTKKVEGKVFNHPKAARI